ncbi:MAG: hypothetical protein LLG93_00130 [Deltaproteobacteria bacterium]|nr:hypothetical protein [Deltaproteobacteria bacterium]
MAKNLALFGRREVFAGRRFVTGVTASVPLYKEVDTQGHKEWLVDVYLSPADNPDQTILRDVPIAPYAKNLVTDVRQPVTLERSKQGSYSVIGRAKVSAAGAGGDPITDPTYRFVRHNYASLRARFVADLDYTLEPLQGSPLTEFQADPAEPFQVVRAVNAFGHQVLGPEVTDEPREIRVHPKRRIRTRHVVSQQAKFGPKGDPEAMDWGTSIFQPTILKVVEQETEV